MIDRFRRLFARRKRAKNIGVSFKRSANFKIPGTMFLAGKEVVLTVPDENGIKMAFIDLILDDCYGCRSLTMKREKISTILDIGANVGFFDLMAREFFPGAVIHAYEPNPNLEQYLSVQAATTGTRYFMEAVGGENGSIVLDLNEDSVQTRSIADPQGEIAQIAFKTAIERIGGEVDLLKIDCEGAEWDIFEDAASWRHVRHVSMEYHLWPNHTHGEVKDVMQGLGFRINTFNPLSNFGLLTASRDD